MRKWSYKNLERLAWDKIAETGNLEYELRQFDSKAHD